MGDLVGYGVMRTPLTAEGHAFISPTLLLCLIWGCGLKNTRSRIFEINFFSSIFLLFTSLVNTHFLRFDF